MREKRKKGYYFYRSLFFTMLIGIVVTSMIMVFRYYTQYDQQIERLYEDQRLFHFHTEQHVSDQLRYIAENLNLISKYRSASMTANQASIIQEAGDTMMALHKIETLIFFDANNQENIEHDDTLEPYYQAYIASGHDDRIQSAESGIVIDSFVVSDGVSAVSLLNQEESDEGLKEYVLAILEMDRMIDDSQPGDGNDRRFTGDEGLNQNVQTLSFEFSLHDIGNLYSVYGIETADLGINDGFVQKFSEAGLYTITRVALDDRMGYAILDDSGFEMFLVSFVPYDTFLTISQKIFTDQMQFGIMLYIILFVLSYGLSSILNDLNHEREIIKHHVTYDFQTGCYSKSAGIDFLSKTFELSKRKNKPLTLVSMIVNQLTENHEAEDEMNRTFYEMINTRIRHSDFVIRMRNQEYLIILYDCRQEDAQHIFNQVIEDNRETTERYGIYLGIVDTEKSSSNHLNQLIREAEKRSHRSREKSRIDQMISRLDKNQS